MDFTLMGQATEAETEANAQTNPVLFGRAVAATTVAPVNGNGAQASNGTVGQQSDGTKKSAANIQPGLNIDKTQFQKAIHYADSFDTANVDSQYSGYRGQQEEYLLPHVKAAVQLKSYLGNGGLSNTLGAAQATKATAMKNLVDAAVANLEAAAQTKNKAQARALAAQGKCFEGELYGATNCNRQYQATYISNVDYSAVLNQFQARFTQNNLKSYTPRVKDSYSTNARGLRN
jgi:hypothetical protein